eukprot:scaffold7266_cov403-Prasinococcus_capsulatus_cf.AAC.3
MQIEITSCCPSAGQHDGVKGRSFSPGGEEVLRRTFALLALGCRCVCRFDSYLQLPIASHDARSCIRFLLGYYCRPEAAGLAPKVRIAGAAPAMPGLGCQLGIACHVRLRQEQCCARLDQ